MVTKTYFDQIRYAIKFRGNLLICSRILHRYCVVVSLQFKETQTGHDSPHVKDMICAGDEELRSMDLLQRW